MKIVLSNALDLWKEKAKRAVDVHFNGAATANIHRAAAHRRKRTEAAAVVSGQAGPVSFAGEAERMGVSLEAFAALILSKPDEEAEREDTRRQIVEKLRAANTVKAIESILANAGIEFPADQAI